jgi:hypothetical protein
VAGGERGSAAGCNCFAFGVGGRELPLSAQQQLCISALVQQRELTLTWLCKQQHAWAQRSA